MANVYEWLDAGNTLVGDGAMGTALQDLGLTDGGAPELWNVDQPAKVASVLDGYAAAGANRNRQCIALCLTYKVSSLVHIRE